MGAIIFEGDFIVSGQFSGGGGQFSLGAIVRVALFLEGNCPGGNFAREQLSGVQISSGAIVRTPWGKLSGGQLSGHLILDLCGISSIAMLLWR